MRHREREQAGRDFRLGPEEEPRGIERRLGMPANRERHELGGRGAGELTAQERARWARGEE